MEQKAPRSLQRSLTYFNAGTAVDEFDIVGRSRVFALAHRTRAMRVASWQDCVMWTLAGLIAIVAAGWAFWNGHTSSR